MEIIILKFSRLFLFISRLFQKVSLKIQSFLIIFKSCWLILKSAITRNTVPKTETLFEIIHQVHSYQQFYVEQKQISIGCEWENSLWRAFLPAAHNPAASWIVQG